MGKVLSIASKPIRDFNLESRAHKIISQDKPIPAPRHKRDALDYESIQKDFPDVYEESLRKDKNLDRHLKDVYVVSKDSNPEMASLEYLNKKQNPDKPLPLSRKTVEDFEFGIKEPTKSPIGKVTLRKALRFITDHQADPKTYNIAKISDDYILPEEKVKNILKYFKVFEIYMPKDKKEKATFAGPSVARTVITKEKRKQLPEPPKKDDT